MQVRDKTEEDAMTTIDAGSESTTAAVRRLTTEFLTASPDGLKKAELLDRLRQTLPAAPPATVGNALTNLLSGSTRPPEIEKVKQGLYRHSIHAATGTGESAVVGALGERTAATPEAHTVSTAEPSVSEIAPEATKAPAAPLTLESFETNLRDLLNRYAERAIKNVRVAVQGGKRKKLKKQEIVGLVKEAEALVLKSIVPKAFKNAALGEPFKWDVTGRGPDKKKPEFVSWYNTRVGERSCVYVFVNRQERSLYVGRTKSAGANRPADHFGKHWFGQTVRIDIYIPRKPIQDLPRLECLAMHVFEPLKPKIKAAKMKYGSACPACAAVDGVKEELGLLFRLRK